MWQRGSPLVFQQFRNYYYGRHSINYKGRVHINSIISSDFDHAQFNFFSDWTFIEFTDPSTGTCINLSNLTKTLQNSIQGSVTNNRACTIMLLMNLAEPDWLFIPCKKKILYCIVCAHKSHLKYHLLNYKSLNGKHCGTLDAIILDACYAFVWQEKLSVQLNFCEHAKGKTSYLAEFKQFKHFFKTFPIGVKTPVIVLKHSSNIIIATEVVFDTFNIPTITKTNTTRMKSQGYHVCHLNKFYAVTDSVTYTCAKGGHISLRYVCDQTIDCPKDNSDEQNCTFSIFPQKMNTSYHLTGRTKECQPHYFTNIYGQLSNNIIQNSHCKKKTSMSSLEIDVYMKGKIASSENHIFNVQMGTVIHPHVGK